MEYRLSPSILSADFLHLADDIEKTKEAGAPYLHFDVMDGDFVPQISFGMPILKAVRKTTDQVLDTHLMIREPERYLKEFASCGADIITFHLEATFHVKDCIDIIHDAGKKAGLAINPETEVAAALPYLQDLDLLLVMSVHPGFGGQNYLPESDRKLKEARKAIDEAGLTEKVELEVDGGINRETVGRAMEAGATCLVAGSAVFGGKQGDVYSSVRYYNDLFTRG